MKHFPRRSVYPVAILVGIIALLAATRIVYLEEQGNFHAVSPGTCYRSAQMDRDEIEHYVKKYRIRSVINLRGQHTGEVWYDEEVETCRDLGVEHYDIKMSARRMPSSEKVEALLDLFEKAPRPVLIHCKGGADRTGLAAAIWKMAVDGASKTEASRELSLFYGHMPMGETQAMNEFFDRWAREMNREDPGALQEMP